MMRDDELLEPGTCGHSVSSLSAGFRCVESGDHDEHVWRGEARASRGLGYGDNVSTDLEVRWRDDRPAATVGDVAAYDQSGALLASATVDPDGKLSEPLHVPAGGYLRVMPGVAVGWPSTAVRMDYPCSIEQVRTSR